MGSGVSRSGTVCRRRRSGTVCRRRRSRPYAAAACRRPAATAEAITVYRSHASAPYGRIAQLAASAAHRDPTVTPAFAALVAELLTAL